MSKLSRLASYFIYGLNALLVFLWFYRDQISVPAWLQTFGRMHPMLLHLPIGFFVMAVLIILFRNQFKSKAFKKSLKLVFIFTALTLAVTALAGITLSREGGYDEDTLTGHVNAGVLLSLVSAVLASFSLKKKATPTQFSVVAVGFLLLIVTGHYGSTLTHGENYLFDSASESPVPEDSATVFSKAVLPVLNKKCGSCHNPTKRKGELILITQEGILKGGEDGAIIDVANPAESEMLIRIHYDLDHDDHMPPSGKPQLTSNELKMLETWIKQGSDFERIWNAANENDSLVLLASAILPTYEKTMSRKYDFAFASSDDIESLNSPFRTVSQIATNEPALKASYYLAQYFSPADLKKLQSVQSQIVELNLSGMPVTDNDIDLISSFDNLEILNLNNTKITDQSINNLAALPNLEKLSLTGTKITSKSLDQLIEFKSLREIYIWNTDITKSQVDNVRSLNKGITWDIGYQAEENELLKLTPPILNNTSFLLKPGETISLKHNLPGTDIRISLDGNEPDSLNATIYSEPITIGDHTTIKTLATKSGWLKSNTLEYNFYLMGITPIKTELPTATDKKYEAKGATSLVDNNIGDADNFRDGNWLGFRENKMVAQFSFDENKKPSKLTLIYNKSIGSYLMPPESVEIWGGNNGSFKLLTTLKPEQPVKYLPTRSESISYTLKQPVNTIKIIASPVRRLPQWHSGKGEKGWLMVSEIIFR